MGELMSHFSDTQTSDVVILREISPGGHNVSSFVYLSICGTCSLLE